MGIESRAVSGESSTISDVPGHGLPASLFPMLVIKASTLRIVTGNAAAAAAYGFAHTDIAGRHASELIPGLARLDLNELETWRALRMRMRKRGGQAWAGELTIVRRDNGEAAVLVRPLARGHSRTLIPRLPAADEPHARYDAAAGIPWVRCDPRWIVGLAIARVFRRAHDRHVEIIGHVACGDVWIRPDAWSAALYELVDNAVRASRRGDFVFVDVCDAGDGDTLWHVQDTGDGMSPYVLAALGRPEAKGGINLARAAVDVHGGLLGFESNVNVGTTATILLPRNRWATISHVRTAS